MSHMAEEKRERRRRRSFSDEFKAGAVRLVLDEGKSISQVATELDLTASALGDWVARERADRSKGKSGLTTAEREELAQLRKEVRELRVERDILKQAAALRDPHEFMRLARAPAGPETLTSSPSPRSTRAAARDARVL